MRLQKISKKISIDELLSNIDQEEAFRIFCPGFKKLGRSFQSPLRKDKQPSFAVFKGSSGNLYWKDFATGSSGTIVYLVSQIHRVSTSAAAGIIGAHFNLCDTDGTLRSSLVVTPRIYQEKEYADIQVEYQSFNKRALKYWQKFLITEEDLIREKIRIPKKVWMNGRKLYGADYELCFVYEFDIPGYKIYFPKRKEYKWFSNIPISIIENIDNIKNSERAILTKSRKDRLVLQKVVDKVASTQNESTGWCIPQNFEILNTIGDLWINFDNDPPGVEACKKITKQYGYKYINVPRYCYKQGITDFASWLEVEGTYDPIIRFLEKKKYL